MLSICCLCQLLPQPLVQAINARRHLRDPANSTEGSISGLGMTENIFQMIFILKIYFVQSFQSFIYYLTCSPRLWEMLASI